MGPLLVSRAYDSPSPFVRRACLDIGTALPSWQHSKKRLFLLRRFVGRRGSRRRFIDKICCMKAYLRRRTSVPCLGVSVCACSGEHVEMRTALFTLAVCAVVTGLRQFLPRVTIVRALSLLVVPGWPWGRAACLRLAYAGLSRRRHSRGTCLSTRRICRFTTLVSAMICHSASFFLCRVGRMCYREAAGDCAWASHAGGGSHCTYAWEVLDRCAAPDAAMSCALLLSRGPALSKYPLLFCQARVPRVTFRPESAENSRS